MIKPSPVLISKFIWLSLVPTLWVFIRSWHDFVGYSLPYLMTGVLLNTLLAGGLLYVLAMSGRVPPKPLIACAVLLSALSVRVHVIPILPATVFFRVHLYMLLRRCGSCDLYRA